MASGYEISVEEEEGDFADSESGLGLVLLPLGSLRWGQFIYNPQHYTGNYLLAACSSKLGVIQEQPASLDVEWFIQNLFLQLGIVSCILPHLTGKDPLAPCFSRLGMSHLQPAPLDWEWFIKPCFSTLEIVIFKPVTPDR